MTEPALPPLIQALCDPALHGNPKGGVRLVETHISWVILTGEYAYKIKKPVNFGFLDYSTLALRHRFCLEELRLNRRLAPFLYMDVVAITDERGTIGFDGTGPVLEYAVKLRQFDESCLADRLLGQSRLSPAQIDGLARTLAYFHGKATHAGHDDAYGNPKTILAAAEHNFDHLLRLGGLLDANASGDNLTRLNALLSWTRAEFQRLQDVFRSRKKDGFVRECHGDLHSGNLVLIGGDLVPFDCIEFSQDLRWIDCMSEIAFIVMDIEERGRSDLAWRLLNRYLEISGDYEGLQVLDFYCVYRALVRAKVAALALEQHEVEAASSRLKRQDGASTSGNLFIGNRLKNQCQRYLDYADWKRDRGRVPVLLVTHGFSGSGKSHFAKALAERLPAIRIASDTERKRLAGLNALEQSHSALQGGIYSASMTRQTYNLLLGHAELLLQAGFNVILDATFLDAANRCHCRELASRLGLRFFILDFLAPLAVLSERIDERLRRGGDPSEAGQAVLALQVAKANPLQTQETPFVLTVDTTQDADIDGILRAIGIGGG